MKKKQPSPLIIPGAITEEDIPKINQIISTLENDPNCQIFLLPVDYISLGLTDYLQIVKTPMDISTVKSKISSMNYNSVQEVINDLMQIWKNCKNYNIEGSDIYNIAVYMEKIAKKVIEKYYKVKFPKQEKFTFIKDYEEEDFLPPHQGENEISMEDKINLSDSIRRLTNEGLSAVVEFLKLKCPKALAEVDKDKLRICIDNIDKNIYFQIQEILSSFNSSRERKTRKLEAEETKGLESVDPNNNINAEEFSIVKAAVNRQSNGNNVNSNSNSKVNSNNNSNRKTADYKKDCDKETRKISNSMEENNQESRENEKEAEDRSIGVEGIKPCKELTHQVVN